MLANPWVILAVVLAWIGSLVAVGEWQNEAGKDEVRAEVLAKENKQLAAANKELDRLRGVEQASAAHVAAIGDTHAKQISGLEARRVRDVANARAGALKLRIPNACPAEARAGEAPKATGGGDGAEGGELPPEITGRLLDLAADADRNTIQLSACQAVITEYLNTQEKQ